MVPVEGAYCLMLRTRSAAAGSFIFSRNSGEGQRLRGHSQASIVRHDRLEAGSQTARPLGSVALRADAGLAPGSMRTMSHAQKQCMAKVVESGHRSSVLVTQVRQCSEFAAVRIRNMM